MQRQPVQTVRTIHPETRLQVVFGLGFVDVLLITSGEANLQFVFGQKANKRTCHHLWICNIRFFGRVCIYLTQRFPSQTLTPFFLEGSWNLGGLGSTSERYVAVLLRR